MPPAVPTLVELARRRAAEERREEAINNLVIAGSIIAIVLSIFATLFSIFTHR